MNDLYVCVNPEQKFYYGSYSSCKYPEGLSDIELFYLPENFQGSNYSGSLYNKANHEAFLKNFKREGIYDLHGGYNTYAVAIRKDVAQQDDIKEVLEQVENFGILSYETYESLIEKHEKISWKSWVRSSLISSINKKVENFKWSERNIYRLFNDILASNDDLKWVPEENELYIDVDLIADYISEEIIVKKTPKKELALLLGKSWKNEKAEKLFMLRLKKD